MVRHSLDLGLSTYVTTNGILFRPVNITNLVLQNSYVVIMALGMLLVIVAGHIDLSVGSVAAFVGAISGVFAVNMGLPWWLSIVLSLLIGALVGAWQGFWIAYVGIPAFIVTLAGMLIFRGLARMGGANALNEALSGVIAIVLVAAILDVLFLLIARITTPRGLNV